MILPKFMLDIPMELETCKNLSKKIEIDIFMLAWNKFCDNPESIGNSKLAREEKIRAFRLIQNANNFLEIGTFNKANLAWLSSLLAFDAKIIDLDIQLNPIKERLIKNHIKPEQNYTSIIGDSTHLNTRNKVIETLNGDLLDAIFIDANHVMRCVLADFAQFANLVKPDGYIFFHDIQWEGSEKIKGVADAIEIIQRYAPVYQCVGNNPISHFHRPFKNGQFWGGIGIVLAKDLIGLI